MGLLKYSGRVLESEAMLTVEEARTYDRLSVQYLDILHKGFVETVLNMCPLNGSVLEVGTGTGRISIELAKYGPDLMVVGIDLSEDMLTVAAQNALKMKMGQRVSFLHGDAKRLPFPAGMFDAVISHQVLHHLPEPLGMVEESFRVVKPGGIVAIRDLVRPADALIPWHARVFGRGYDVRMKKQYVDSMRAALTISEWEDLLRQFKGKGAQLHRQFVTHCTLQCFSGSPRLPEVRLPGKGFEYVARRLYVD